MTSCSRTDFYSTERGKTKLRHLLLNKKDPSLFISEKLDTGLRLFREFNVN